VSVVAAGFLLGSAAGGIEEGLENVLVVLESVGFVDEGGVDGAGAVGDLDDGITGNVGRVVSSPEEAGGALGDWGTVPKEGKTNGLRLGSPADGASGGAKGFELV